MLYNTPLTVIPLIAVGLIGIGIVQVQAQVDISQLTPEQIQQIQEQTEQDPVLELEEEPVNATDDRQMNIRPSDILPPNGTLTMNMQGAEDIDYKGLNPVGITTIITNETVTVTNQPVEQPGVAAEEAAPAPTAAPAPAPTAEPEPAAEEEQEEEEE